MLERERDFDSKMQEPWRSMRSSNGGSSSDIVKPFLNGCITGQLHVLLSHTIRYIDSVYNKSIPRYNIIRKTMLRRDLVCAATYRTVSLGMFEILSKKLRNDNDGKPLTLFQEAWCGLTSGAAAGFVWQPFFLAQNRVGIYNFTCTNWFGTLFHMVKDEGVFTLWRGSTAYIGEIALLNMGMLASYNRSLNYLTESKGLSRPTAQFSASIISAFFAAACVHPYPYILGMKDVLKDVNRTGIENATVFIPSCISKILTPYSGFKFYSSFFAKFRRCALIYLVQWSIFEQVRRGNVFTTPDSKLEKLQISDSN